MALIDCPDCGKRISDAAPTCIHCGRPMTKPRQSPPDGALPPSASTKGVFRITASRQERCRSCGKIYSWHRGATCPECGTPASD